MLTVQTTEQVASIMKQHFQSIIRREERVPLAEAVGRVSARTVLAPEDIPGFDRSTVDGYAVKASACRGASEALPALFRLKGSLAMGRVSAEAIGEEETYYIPTGGALPPGADAVAMIEDAQLFGDEVAILTPLQARDNVILRGDDVREGASILPMGTRIRPQHVGLLAGLGITTLWVYAKPRVAILSTGDEVVPIESTLRPGQVRDANSPMLAAFLEAEGCQVTETTHAPDDPNALEETLRALLTSSDLVLLSGGSSVGTKDHTSEVLERLGPPGVLFHGVAIKPGKPTLGAGAGDRPIIGLPGHPASCLIAYEAVVAPMIQQLYVGKERSKVRLAVQADFNDHTNHGRDAYLTVKLKEKEGRVMANPVRGKSGMVSLLSEADGYTIIPRSQEGITRGDTLWVTLFGGDER
jgi:molybdopterin molybdotransferase